MSCTPVDRIAREVFQHQITGVAEEMSMALRRSAFSSIIWDMYDYACALFTPGGEMIAQARSIPAQLGIMSSAFRGMVGAIPLDEWRPGDVIICNDPYRGCTHTPDIVLFSPVFRDGELVGLSSTIAHHVDIGGKVPCTVAPDNLEVFAEGLTIPPLKLVEAGTPNRVIFDILGANTRNPAACLGDLRAQIAGCRTGERRLAELVGKHGIAQFRALAQAALDYTDGYVGRVLSGLGGGSSRAELLIEDGLAEDAPIRLVATVEVRDAAITVDFDGSSPQRANALNCPYASTISMVHYAVRCLVAGDLPQNDGCARRVAVRVPSGTVLNPVRPAAVGSRHFTQQAVAEVVLKAMASLFPGQAAAGSQISFPSLRAGGFDDRPQRRSGSGAAPYYIIADILGGGMGGSPTCDGLDAVDTHGGNCALLSAEVMETLSPFRVLRSELVPGTGGAGTHRGGLAVRRDYQLLSEQAILGAYVQQVKERTVPWGARGGSGGAPACAVLNPGTPAERVLPPKTIGHTMRRGDVLRLQSSGGGGWGDPAARAPAASNRDIEHNLVHIES